MKFIMEINDIGIITYTLKILIISIVSYYTALKLMARDIKKRFGKYIIYIMLISITCSVMKYLLSGFICVSILTLLMSFVFSKSTNSNFGFSLSVVIISLSINYIIFLAATALTFFPIIICNITNMYIGLSIISIFYMIFITKFLKIKRFKKGFVFLQDKKNDYCFELLVLNVSIIILFMVVMLSNYTEIKTGKIGVFFIIFSIIMFITIQKSLQLYYKQKMLIKELEESKKEIKKKNKEIEELEKENINISKKSHTLSHKQKTLEHKIEQMLNKAEISKEEAAEIQERLKAINKEFNKEKIETELTKTEIPEIDDTIKYMQSESIKNNIDFELQINGNIYHMINNIIPKEELETLLADHIKNAIIAIKHTNNINKSILVKIGEIDKTYGISIYDSGIEFEKETLNNLGKKPSTTHKNEGGTGMGFMNTFDTLKKYKASLIIEEYSKPNKDNYTKAIIIKFDGKNEFTINSYRKK